MSKFKGICENANNGKVNDLGVFKTREECANALVEWSAEHIDYCLDRRSDREEALANRNTYVCGCGPWKLKIVDLSEEMVEHEV